MYFKLEVLLPLTFEFLQHCLEDNSLEREIADRVFHIRRDRNRLLKLQLIVSEEKKGTCSL